MKLLTFHRDGEIKQRYGVQQYKAGIDYVFPEAQFVERMRVLPQTIAKTSDLNSITPNFSAPLMSGLGETLLYHCSAGGIGDEIMGIPIVLHLVEELGYNVTVLCTPGAEAVWQNCPHIDGILSFPLEYSKWSTYQHHCIFDHVTNLNEHGTQRHPTETMALRIGVDPDSLQHLSHPLWFTDAEIDGAKKRNAQNGKGRLGIYQLASSRPIRRFSPLRSAQVLKALVREFKDIYWVALYDEAVPKNYIELADAIAVDNMNTAQYPSLRELFADTAIAEIVVAPDSMMVHLAGTLGVPFVSLFSNIDPMKRTNRYHDHLDLWEHKACPAAPCYYQRGGWPEVCPPSIAPREMCECIKNISTKEIIDSVHALLA